MGGCRLASFLKGYLMQNVRCVPTMKRMQEKTAQHVWRFLSNSVRFSNSLISLGLVLGLKQPPMPNTVLAEIHVKTYGPEKITSQDVPLTHHKTTKSVPVLTSLVKWHHHLRSWNYFEILAKKKTVGPYGISTWTLCWWANLAAKELMQPQITVFNSFLRDQVLPE